MEIKPWTKEVKPLASTKPWGIRKFSWELHKLLWKIAAFAFIVHEVAIHH